MDKIVKNRLFSTIEVAAQYEVIEEWIVLRVKRRGGLTCELFKLTNKMCLIIIVAGMRNIGKGHICCTHQLQGIMKALESCKLFGRHSYQFCELPFQATQRLIYFSCQCTYIYHSISFDDFQAHFPHGFSKI